ncbi:MAG: zinc-binding dehydrogenase [Xenococcaceae cyanobacterium MO_207.B15]|nr:zinc-binding dehydrogenase [Xenococcaceae cyanobacterium MO_207.B15]
MPSWNKWLYEVIWKEQSSTINAQLSVTKDCYIVVTADSNLGNKIASALHNQNQECLFIYLREEYQKIDDCNYSIYSDVAAEYNIFYQEIIQAYSPDKIIYLATSDNSNTDTYTLSQDYRLSEIVTKQCSQLLFLIQTLIQNQTAKPPRLYIVTNNHPVSQSPSLSVSLSSLWGMGKTIALEYPELNCTCIDYDALETDIQPLLTDICNSGDETQIIYRKGKRQVARLTQKLHHHEMVKIDGEKNSIVSHQLIIRDRSTLENLQWEIITPQAPQQGEVTIQVFATGLNFRDVLNALNMYPGEAGELGLECSGVITAVGEGVNNLQVGDRVIAIAAGSFSSYVTVDANLVIPIPSSLSFAEAATIPTAFLTAYYCLHHLAAIKPGDKILIHSAAGGVGLAAVQLCQQVGAEIFATASPSKWEYLKSLGINHGMNSRNLDFADEILSITQGEGIKSIPSKEAVEILKYLLSSASPQVGVLPIDWKQWQIKTPFYENFQENITTKTKDIPNDSLEIYNRDRIIHHVVAEVTKL